MSPHDSTIRLINEPYPGMRPFLDHEALLLFGRTEQVREVIKRLEQTRFVAVIGGSGSGKSSLIRAGVVPSLRSYALPEAGAYWVPVICTPGTIPQSTPQPGGSAGSRVTREQTPVTRLAWKLSQLLQPLATPSDEAEADRRAEIAALFRRGSGFGRLVDVYHGELPQQGPDGRDARFLFVIDQFEELFHPSNHGNDDARHVIEAVIDHFFNPHERCFVVMTMRSEHLSDCAAFLELPDAINRSMYLVRRLNEQELREATVGAAARYLRLRQRGEPGQQTSLPPDVVFEERVIRRLLYDTASIASDPDHLPLLQHVLARTWQAACQREGVPTRGVPAEVRWIDLEHAVAPGAGPGETCLPEEHNTLCESLDNWAKYIYSRRPPEEQAQIDAVLRKLAFKHPDNGLYFQRRVDVDDPSLLPGIHRPRQRLRELLNRGFLDSVNYIYWDDEDPDRVTLKVSHEALIRGWEHFRELVDDEADRLDELVAVLRRCKAWKADPTLLLGASELARVDAFGLNSVLEADDTRRQWFRALLECRDGERLARFEPDVNQFLANSRARLRRIEQANREAAEAKEKVAQLEAQRKLDEAERKQRNAEAAAAGERIATLEAQRKQDEADLKRNAAEGAREKALSSRNRWRAVAAVVVAVAAVVVAAAAVGSFAILRTALDGMGQFASVRSGADRVAGELVDDLRQLVALAKQVDEAKDRTTFLGVKVDAIPSILPGVSQSKRLLQLANQSAEPVVNGKLRHLLTRVIWPARVHPVGSSQLPPLKVKNDDVASCRMGDGPGNDVRGIRLSGHGRGRVLFIPHLDEKVASKDNEIALYEARNEDGRCVVNRRIWSVPGAMNPALLFDAHVSRLAVALTDPFSRHNYVQFVSIAWKQDEGSSFFRADIKELSVSPVQDAAALVRQEVPAPSKDRWHVPAVKMADTWLTDVGLTMSVRKEAWLVFTEGAHPRPYSRTDWTALSAAPGGSRCASLHGRHHDLAATLPSQGKSSMYQGNGFCFEIQPAGPAEPLTTLDPPRQVRAEDTRQFLVANVYAEPENERSVAVADSLPSPVAHLALGWFATAHDWLVGAASSTEGWIAVKNGDSEVLAAPWSTSALRKLGEEVKQ